MLLSLYIHLRVDPYSACLNDMPRKIMWTIFLRNSFNFSKAFEMFRKIVTIISIYIFVPLYASKLHARVPNKIMQALTKLQW